MIRGFEKKEGFPLLQNHVNPQTIDFCKWYATISKQNAFVVTLHVSEKDVIGLFLFPDLPANLSYVVQEWNYPR